MISREEFIVLKKEEQKKKNRQGKKVALFVFLMALGLVCGWVSMRYSYYEILAKGAGVFGFEEREKQLNEVVARQKWEQEAKEAFGADVVWIEVPRKSASRFKRIAMNYIPLGVGLSFSNSKNKGMIRSCVSKECALELQAEISGVVILNQ